LDENKTGIVSTETDKHRTGKERKMLLMTGSVTKLRQRSVNLQQTKANTLLTVANKGNNSSALPKSEIHGL